VLLLFDIDGTLLQRAADAHRDAIHEALHKVHGVTPAAILHGHEVAGRTDTEIARGLLVAAGVSARRIDERADAVRIAACEAYARSCPGDLSAHVTPGFGQLLQARAARGRDRLALVTGNYEAIARLKLRAAGLGGFFPSGQGGFGSDHEDRTELPRIARRRAGEHDAPWPRERTVVIGDTPRDIACARADGVRVFAVATGPFPAAELTAADAVARNARELGALLDDLG
jgi:phosphoglycolate phosphatase-like HAD superfamily hydrolase